MSLSADSSNLNEMLKKIAAPITGTPAEHQAVEITENQKNVFLMEPLRMTEYRKEQLERRRNQRFEDEIDEIENKAPRLDQPEGTDEAVSLQSPMHQGDPNLENDWIGEEVILVGERCINPAEKERHDLISTILRLEKENAEWRKNYWKLKEKYEDEQKKSAARIAQMESERKCAELQSMTKQVKLMKAIETEQDRVIELLSTK